MPGKETRRAICKMIGEAHWTLYLEYYKQYLKHPGNLTKIRLANIYIIVPLHPPFPTLSLKLDEYVTSHIFSYLSQWQGHVWGIQSLERILWCIGTTPEETTSSWWVLDLWIILANELSWNGILLKWKKLYFNEWNHLHHCQWSTVIPKFFIW